MTPDREEITREAERSLTRIAELNAHEIGLRNKLGDELNFEEAIPALDRAVSLFREISPEILPDLSQALLTAVRQNSDELYNLTEQARSFSAASSNNPKQIRDRIIQQINSAYDGYFEQVWPAIAYSSRRAVDFSRLEREARSAVQSIEDRTRELEDNLRARNREAELTLEEIRKVAAEQGVSQQAIYFKEEFEYHEREANSWLKRSAWITVVLIIYAASTLVLHKIPWIAPSGSAEAIQFGIGKALIFASIAYFLLLSSRNYMSHRHNAVVNKHRQNSLVTYRVIMESAQDSANREIILAKAADSIFGPQSTGFTRHDGDDGRAFSMVNLGANAIRTSSSG